MPFPPSKNRRNVTDPNADAVAREQLKLKEMTDGARSATPAAPNSYADRVKLVTDEVASQTARER